MSCSVMLNIVIFSYVKHCHIPDVLPIILCILCMCYVYNIIFTAKLNLSCICVILNCRCVIINYIYTRAKLKCTCMCEKFNLFYLQLFDIFKFECGIPFYLKLWFVRYSIQSAGVNIMKICEALNSICRYKHNADLWDTQFNLHM